jgi:hypothetical protein
VKTPPVHSARSAGSARAGGSTFAPSAARAPRWGHRLREGGEAACALGALMSALVVLFHVAGGF